MRDTRNNQTNNDQKLLNFEIQDWKIVNILVTISLRFTFITFKYIFVMILSLLSVSVSLIIITYNASLLTWRFIGRTKVLKEDF